MRQEFYLTRTSLKTKFSFQDTIQGLVILTGVRSVDCESYKESDHVCTLFRSPYSGL